MSLRKKLESLIPEKYLSKCKKELDYIEKQKLEGYFLKLSKLKKKIANTCNSYVAYAIGFAEKPQGELKLESDYASPPDWPSGQ